MDGWIDAWMDGWKEWMEDVQMDNTINGWTDR